MTRLGFATDRYLDYVPATGTAIAPPLVVADPEGQAWDSTCDMLVIGYGLAGAAAALRAEELGGLDVVLADRFAGGGTSAVSGGVVYAGGGTRVQQSVHAPDSVENLYDYITHEASTVRRPETLRRFARRSASMIDWLEARGVRYGGPLETRKTSYPPPDKFLYFSGNEVAPAYATAEGPAPRGHRAIPVRDEDRKRFSGFILMSTLQRYVAEKTGIRTMLRASARRLVTDATGRVIGAEIWQLPPGSKAEADHARLQAKSQNMMAVMLGLARRHWLRMAEIERQFAQPVLIRARRGVVLATGGYGNNPQLLEATAPDYYGNRISGTLGCDGSAVRMGVSVGARVGQMHVCSPWRFISPPVAWMKGVIVNARGERIVNEQLYGANVGDAIMLKGQGKAWLITDKPLQDQARLELKDKSIWPFQRLPARFAAMTAKKAATLGELERKLGFPEGSLVATIGQYNTAIHTGQPDAFAKGDEQRVPLETGPFYAINESAKVKLNPMGQITLGGLDVDEATNAVLDEQGQPIAGLFAAGRSAVGICSQNYVSGMSLADCIFSGWTAAETIAGKPWNE
jgi:3-oxo-5alpha-steroid 4-dehydrogenase